MVRSQRLSALEVASKSDPGRYGDGDGLYLQVSKWRTKSWIFRYERDGRERQMGLGPAGPRQVSLSEARKHAARCAQSLRDGLDPIEERKERVTARRVQAARTVTFKKCAEDYITEKESGWRNEKHRAQWTATLETYAYPVFGDLPVAAVDLPLVMKALKPIWTIKPETAGRVRGRIESVLSYATVHGFRQGDNPARWRGHLDQILPAKAKVATVAHHKALPFNEVAAFLKGLREKDNISAKALEFTILTAARTGETIGATPTEIDLKQAIWIVPGARMKAGKEHRVPLSARVVEIVRSLKHNQKFLFPGAKVDQPLSNMAMLEMLRGMVGGGLTVHGFRSSFMDWGHEVTDYPKEMLDIALAHTVSDKVEAAYRRGDMFEKRRSLMADWAAYCALGAGVNV
jgi:integrase